MKINYSEEAQQLEIVDNSQAKAFINGALLIMLLLIGMVHWFDIWLNGVNYSNLALSLVGLIAMVALVFSIIKITNKNKLNLTEITSLNQMVIFNNRYYYFKLNNKKIRSLEELKNSDAINEVIELIQNKGIEFKKVADPFRFLKYRKTIKKLLSNEP